MGVWRLSLLQLLMMMMISESTFITTIVTQTKANQNGQRQEQKIKSHMASLCGFMRNLHKMIIVAKDFRTLKQCHMRMTVKTNPFQKVSRRRS